MYTVTRHVTEFDIAEMSVLMRDADRHECYLTTGDADVRHALALSVDLSTMACTVRDAGALVCILGVTPYCGMLSEEGSPWMVGTDLIAKYPKTLVKMARRVVRVDMLALHSRLTNFVHRDNRVSVRWLRRIGFVFDGPYAFGSFGAPFYRFSMGV